MTGHALALLCILTRWASHTSNEDAVLLDISPMTASERAYVANSWKMSALDAPLNAPLKETGMVGKHFDRYNAEVQRVLDSGATVLVAREATDPSFIYGWMAVGLVGGQLALYYCNTKFHYRRVGVCRALRDRVLDLVPQDEPLEYVYTARSVRDPVFERWGFEYRDLDDVLISDEQRQTA
jgi:hypothetical protein